MSKRKNLIHEKLKRAKPTDKINFQVKLPAYLMADVKCYGDSVKVISQALELAHQTKFRNGLIEIIAEIGKQIEQLEILINSDTESKIQINNDHLLLLEVYKSVRFTLRECSILRRRKYSS